MGQELPKIEKVYDAVSKEYAETFSAEHEKKPKDQEILYKFSQEIGDRKTEGNLDCCPVCYFGVDFCQLALYSANIGN